VLCLLIYLFCRRPLPGHWYYALLIYCFIYFLIYFAYFGWKLAAALQRRRHLPAGHWYYALLIYLFCFFFVNR
jgi:hypothetical protein